MWHTISFVAESRCIDAEELKAFAIANTDKYGIATDRNEPEVNTWHVDQLVKDFKALSIPLAGNNRDLLKYAVARGHR